MSQVAGAVKHAWSQFGREREGGYSLVQNFQDVLQMDVFDYELLVALEVCAYVLLVWWFARRSRSRQDWLLLTFLVCVFSLAAGHLAKFAQTVLTMDPGWVNYSWYFIPAYLMMSLIIPVRCYVAIHFIRRFIGPRSRCTVNILGMSIVVIGAVFLLAKADFTSPFRLVDWQSESTSREWEVTSYMGVQVMNRVLPEGSVVGSWDAGAIGYFSRFPVVNLDGLVNSYDYFRGMNADRDRYFHQKDEFKPLYQEFGITHLASADIPYLANTFFEGKPFLVQQNPQSFKLASAEPLEDADTTAWFYERMESHFDHRSDGVGLIVDGRMAQAFVRDCAPGELVVWSWVVGQGEETAVDSWTQTGLCVDARVLPHNALPPVRVETMSADDYVARQVGDSPPIIRSDWDVYLVEDSLVYVKNQCSPQDAEPMFFLHLDPVDVNNLPSRSKQHGYDNLDFNFRDHGHSIKGEVCVAIRELPEYAISAIRTGQSERVKDGFHSLWEGSFEVAGQAGAR